MRDLDNFSFYEQEHVGLGVWGNLSSVSLKHVNHYRTNNGTVI